MKSKKELIRTLKAKIKALNSIKTKNDFLLSDLNQLKSELYYLKHF